MLLAQEVIHGFYGIERAQRNFDKNGVPVAHRTIPQARQLKSLDGYATLRFLADESRVRVNKLPQVKLVSLVVLDITYQVNGVEVCATLH